MANFTKLQAQRMRVEIEEALAGIEKKYNAKVKLGGIRYLDTLTVKLTFSKMSENENGAFANTKEAQAFVNRAYSIGVSPEVLGLPMRYQGDNVVITGYSTRAKKYPIKYTRNGKNYKCSESFIQNLVKETRPEFFL